MPEVKVVNIGTELEPKWRLQVDDVIVGRAGKQEDLYPLKEELEGDDRKARAIRDIFYRATSELGVGTVTVTIGDGNEDSDREE